MMTKSSFPIVVALHVSLIPLSRISRIYAVKNCNRLVQKGRVIDYMLCSLRVKTLLLGVVCDTLLSTKCYNSMQQSLSHEVMGYLSVKNLGKLRSNITNISSCSKLNQLFLL